MWYTILEENSRTVLVRMPKSYLSRLEKTPIKSHKRVSRDDEMTPLNMAHYLEAKRDLENGVNVVSGADFISRFNLR